MSNLGDGLTRRRFLELVGAAGGSAAMYETMTALGMINTPGPWQGPPKLRAGSGTGKTVLILGAGIGGLTAAYELTRAGYRCEILEAQNRAGGRSLTARNGTVVVEQGEGQRPTEQVCKFDEGLYANMGPGRLPYHHRRVLHYCRELSVPLEIYVMETMANLFQTDKAFSGKAVPRRRIANDAQGYISELLAKAINNKALDQAIDEADRQKLLSLLKVFGDLGYGKDCGEYSYCGSTRTGCELPLTVHQPCEPEPKLALQELLKSEFWLQKFYQPLEFEWQPTLFQPIGGMDRIVEGFKRKMGYVIEYESEVREIRLQPNGVQVVYRDHFSGETFAKRGDYCLSNIPLPVLQKIPANFSADFKRAVDRGRFDPTCKVAWQAEERFWESDKYQIYGGISYTDDMIVQMWYPSNDYFTGKGTLTGLYNYDDRAIEFGKMGLERRLNVARRGAAKLHPEFRSDAIVPQRLGMSIAWQNVPFQRGGWANWDSTSPEDTKAYARLLAPDGRFHVLGDQVSTLPGWQEGAMMSAEHVVEQIAGIRPLTVPEIERAPHTRRLVQGRFS